jgi:phosphohistidine phosphatase
MKRLIFVRHGKSSWERPLKDFDRPLKKRAYVDAEHVIAALKSYLDFEVDLFTSPAKRAQTTAHLFKEGLQIRDHQFHIHPSLYTFNSDEVLDFIYKRDDKKNSIMLFGHNPAYTELVNRLGNLDIENLPTTGLVSILFETKSWKDIKKGETQLYLFPKNLKS